MDNLSELRVLIDQVDIDIHQLLNKRAALANQVAQIKIADAKKKGDSDIIYYRPEREAAVLHAVKQRNTGPLSDNESARLFREIMSACLALEEPLTIAYLGPAGTFTQAAAYKHFGHSVNTSAFSTINQVFKEVETKNCQYGVVPIENSTEGVISHTLDLFISSSLKIVGEVTLRIHHNLMSKTTDLSSIKTVYSHQQSLAQCRSWLDENFPNVDRVPVKSNAEAARLAQLDDSCAAIAGDIAAGLYELAIHYSQIEDNPDNTTRFLILGHQEVDITRIDGVDGLAEKIPLKKLNKTSLLMSSENKPGALFSLLQPISDNQISMTNIESRPSQCGLWEYVFFIDIEGHYKEPHIQAAISEIEKKATMVKVLGSYPQAVI
ncbi:MAG: prephenate dehydratase [Gammaproteobacteria bacterium]|nr:prephenate dehydratase [Gammaproteobacteria bacterium]